MGLRKASTLRRWILAGFACSLAIAARGAARAENASANSMAARLTPITRQEVWPAVAAELRTRGVSESELPQAEDLVLPVAVPALAGRKLRVSSACWDEGSRRIEFRLECGDAGDCLPFLVYLRNGHPPRLERDSVSTGANFRAASCRLPSSHAAAEARPAPAVRAGEHATAVYVAEGLRMSASVTCLERGSEGQVIRVRAPDGHVFRARISGPARVEALPQ